MTTSIGLFAIEPLGIHSETVLLHITWEITKCILTVCCKDESFVIVESTSSTDAVQRLAN